MFDLGRTFIHLFTAFSLLVHPHTAFHHMQPSLSPNPTETQKMMKATANITEFGKTIHLLAVFPQNGGKVSGDISGDCIGKMQGVYSGDTKGKHIEGKAYAECPLLFITIHGTATFSGTLNETDTNANVTYTVSADNHSQTSNASFTVSSE